MVVINESMARQHFAGLDPLGQRNANRYRPDADFSTMEVSLVGDRQTVVRIRSKSEFFVPTQFPDPVLTECI